MMDGLKCGMDAVSDKNRVTQSRHASQYVSIGLMLKIVGHANHIPHLA